MKKVLVIGSNSFSGSDFIDLLLESGYQVLGISRSPEKSPVFLSYKNHINPLFTFHQIDLNHDLEKMTKILDFFRPEYVVNFAAQSEVAPSWEHPDHWFQTNTVALTRLANILKDRKWIQKYVHISSPEVYGTCIGTVKEEAPLNPSTPYAASKAAGDLSLFTFYKNFHLPLVMIRATNVYGPCQQLFKIIPRSILSLKAGKKIQLHGGGKAIKSYIHIRDVSHGEKFAMEKGLTGQIYHLSPDQGIAVKDVVKLICQQMNYSFEKMTETVQERLGQDKAYVIDSGKARKEWNWAPQIPFDLGIGQTVQWLEKNYEYLCHQSLDYVHKQ